jgi:hypothetical protein
MFIYLAESSSSRMSRPVITENSSTILLVLLWLLFGAELAKRYARDGRDSFLIELIGLTKMLFNSTGGRVVPAEAERYLNFSSN